MSANQDYFLARMNAQGVLYHSHNEKLFIVPIGSKVKFEMDYGTPISRNPKLLVNKPLRDKDGNLSYTITQPKSSKSESNMAKYNNHSILDTEYLETYLPCEKSSFYKIEFEVVFEESGSFFVQIEYEDLIDGKIKYT